MKSVPPGPSEFDRIRWLARETGPGGPRGMAGRLLLGIGDDAALWRPPAGHAVVVTVDAQVEGVHFRSDWLSPAQVGARAVAASASDLAAMAALPGGVLIALTLPRGFAESSFRALYRGALREARRLDLAVLGGNLSSGPLQVCVTSVGAVRPGDGVYVTGRPGRARLGRAILEAPAALRRRLERTRAGAACLRAFRSPRARIAEARFLASRVRPRSLVDVSDGIALDLWHVLERSGPPLPGAALDGGLEALLEADGSIAHECGVDLAEAALSGGEDYELLFTAPPGRAERAASEFRRRFDVSLTRIGTVTRERGLRLAGVGHSDERFFDTKGFDHFR